ncbi:MAG TPA: hypothetical protein VGU26_07990, partial [Gaiellaceae bacterium]|nr:hypothetical protein [Gaiellaceae bacterium]
MTFRARLTLVAATAVALAVVLSSVVVYVVVRDQLRSQVDSALRDRAGEIQIRLGRLFLPDPGPIPGGPVGYVQAVGADGTILRPAGADIPIPVDEHVREVAAGNAGEFFADETIRGVRVRVLTFPTRPGWALQVLRPLDEVESTLERLRTFLIVISLGGIWLAVALGLAVSRAAIAPVARLTRATERVT